MPDSLTSTALSGFGLCMSIGFRFFPGHFLHNALLLPMDKLSVLCDNLGLSYISKPLTPNTSLYFKDLISSGDDHSNMVKQISAYDGKMWRFMVLVVKGLGCTVWYKYAPYSLMEGTMPSDLSFAISSYSNFLDPNYLCPAFFF